MAITEDVESKWYRALLEEDCVVVMELLQSHPNLLKVGWESEPLRQVEGRRRREGTGRARSTWKGRTALHVGASRGCLKLIMQVLKLCDFDNFYRINEEYEKGLRLVEEFSFNKVQVHPGIVCDLCKARPILGNRWTSTVKLEYNLCPNCYEKSQNKEEFVKIEYGLPRGPPGMATTASTESSVSVQESIAGPLGQKTDSSHHASTSQEATVAMGAVQRDITESELPGMERPFAGLSSDDDAMSQSGSWTLAQKRTQAIARKRTQATEKGNSSGNSASTGPAARKIRKAVLTIVRRKRRANSNKRTKTPPDISVSDVDVTDLLRAEDGDCGLNALAIATLHGNRELVTVLKYGMKVCEEYDDRNRTIETLDDPGMETVINKTIKTLHDLRMATVNERNLLRQVMVDVVRAGAISGDDLELYYNHRDFNFLPPEEYLFHFSIISDPDNISLFSLLWDVIKFSSGQVWRFVLQLKDGQGRPPFHAAIEENAHVADLLQVLTRAESGELGDEIEDLEGNGEFLVRALTVPDEVGRTPVHRAAAKGFEETVESILDYGIVGRTSYERLQYNRFPGTRGKLKDSLKEEVAATCYAAWRAHEFLPRKFSDIWRVPLDDDFLLKFPLPQTPLHAAMIHGNFDCARLLIQKWGEKWGDKAMAPYQTLWGIKDWDFFPEGKLTMNIKDFIDTMDMKDILLPDRFDDYDKVSKWAAFNSSTWIWIEWDILEFACLVGAPISFMDYVISFFKVNLTTPRKPSWTIVGQGGQNDDSLGGEKDFSHQVTLKHLWHPLHLVASLGKYPILKYFVNDQECNLFFEDFEENSALHHAMKVTELELKTHLLDYVDPEHVHHSAQRASRLAKKQILEKNTVAERQGCIDLLLQAGCEMFQANKRMQLPCPTGSLNDGKFLSWWYSKLHEEFKKMQNDLNFTTNAIAVTAALVATASYVGPLQPPMGYDANQIQYENVWVSIFIVCDTLSFYLAIVAITLSLIPSLPLQHQAMLYELESTRGMIMWAVGTLLPSVFFVFVAFASSSISVMSANITSEVGGILTIMSTIIGVVLCLFAFILFFARLLAFVYPKNSFISNIYYKSNFFTKSKNSVGNVIIP